MNIETSLSPNIYRVGFETFNPVYNLGGIYIFIVFVAVEASVLGFSFLSYVAYQKFTVRSEHEGGKIKKKEKKKQFTS